MKIVTVLFYHSHLDFSYHVLLRSGRFTFALINNPLLICLRVFICQNSYQLRMMLPTTITSHISILSDQVKKTFRKGVKLKFLEIKVDVQ